MSLLRIDRPAGQLTVLMLALTAVGLLTLATSIPGADGGIDRGYAIRQGAYTVLALGAFLAARLVPVGWIEARWKAIWAVAVGSVLLVVVLGQVTRGSRRWIELGPINVQPSELAKLLVIASIAAMLAHRLRMVDRPSTTLLALAMAGVPMLLVLAQPDLGTALVYGVFTVSMLYFAGVPWRTLGLLTAATSFLAIAVLWLLPAVGVQVLEPHQRDRLLAFADPNSDPQGVAYHANQSRIAIGSGGLAGRDFSEPTQTGQRFLPEPHTDFVYATIAERSGFIGAGVTLGLFALLLWRVLGAVAVAATPTERLLAAGVLAMLATHVIVNIGMTMGLMPITGLPLPFISYGGSAAIANMAAVGLVVGVLERSEQAGVRYARRTRSQAGSGSRQSARDRAAVRARQRAVRRHPGAIH